MRPLIINNLTFLGTTIKLQTGHVKESMYVSDIVDAHIKAVDLQLSPSVKCINLCTGQPYSILNVISTAETVWNMPIKFTFQKRRKGDAEKLFGNYELANDLLGWKPSNSKLNKF